MRSLSRPISRPLSRTALAKQVDNFLPSSTIRSFILTPCIGNIDSRHNRLPNWLYRSSRVHPFAKNRFRELKPPDWSGKSGQRGWQNRQIKTQAIAVRNHLLFVPQAQQEMPGSTQTRCSLDARDKSPVTFAHLPSSLRRSSIKASSHPVTEPSARVKFWKLVSARCAPSLSSNANRESASCVANAISVLNCVRETLAILVAPAQSPPSLPPVPCPEPWHSCRKTLIREWRGSRPGWSCRSGGPAAMRIPRVSVFQNAARFPRFPRAGY